MRRSSSLPLQATVKMVIEDFPTRSAQVVVATDGGHRIEQDIPLQRARERYPIGSRCVIEAATLDSLAMGYEPA